MRRSIWTLSLAFATLLSAGQAFAAAITTVDLNESRRVMLHGAAANVFVADPAVADVAMIDSHSVILLGKGYGVTQVLVTDHSGHTLLDSVVAVVGSEAGRVTVYRGQAAQDYHCSSRCETINGGGAAAPSIGNNAAAAASAPSGPSPGGENAPLNVGPPVTVTQAGGVHP
ncbi:MAG TPA: pilus assembly protein N-terminal domain-containing protein [Caulobacteraceae bacterium]